MSAGARAIGAAALLLGGVGLEFDDFAAVWQPVPAGALGRPGLAYAAAVLFLSGGLALQHRRTMRPGCVILGGLFLLFATLWLPRVFARPLTFATWGGVAEQLACAFGALAVYVAAIAGDRSHSPGLAAFARVGFGLCAVAFGCNHFFALRETAAMVPRWLPPGAGAWAVATGVFHVLGGLALIVGVRSLLAARLLAGMFAGFGALIWAPILWRHPTDHMAWCGNAVNLTLVGAAWGLADLLAQPSSKTAVGLPVPREELPSNKARRLGAGS